LYLSAKIKEMKQPVIVPTDFSETADKALQAAFELARRMHAPLHILHVIQMPMLDAAGPLGYAADAYRELRDQADRDMKVRQDNYAEKEVDLHIEICDGFVADEVVAYCEKHNPAYCVLGTTGASGFLSRIIGSNASHIIRRVNIPVLLIPGEADIRPIKQAVYCAMLESNEIPYLKSAMTFCSFYQAELSLLKVNANLQLNEVPDDIIMNEIKAEFGSKTPALLQISADSPSEGIEDFLEDHPTDLVIMVTRKLGLLDRIFEGSTTRRLALNSSLPMLVLHKSE